MGCGCSSLSLLLFSDRFLDDVIAPDQVCADQLLYLSVIPCPHQAHQLFVVFHGEVKPGLGAKDDDTVAINGVPEALHKVVEPGILRGPVECVMEFAVEAYERLGV